MEFLHAAIAMLASMVFVLAGMVGYIYWQQTRMFHNVNTLSMVLGDLAQSLLISRAGAESVQTPAETADAPADAPVETVQEAEIPTSDDDRVEAEPDATPADVRGPPEPIDTDTLQDKTKKELHDILTKRGIPFGKNDSKGVLISLLKATA
jgi:hypothetical protein